MSTDTTDSTGTTTGTTTEAAEPTGPEAPAPAATAEPAPAEEVEGRRAGQDARRRQQLREAEAQRDALAASVAALQRAETLRIAGEVLAEPGDLFDLTTATVEELLAEDGTVDPAKVAEAARALVAARGDRFARPPSTPPSFGGGARPDHSPRPTAGWSDVLSGRRRSTR
jgi:pyruvate/2-oxoglutarate dehydrogenase complex dihydrolipoamide acyltransferase (E2) component